MDDSRPGGADLDLDEASKAIEKYRQDHPELAEAMRIFEITDDVYRAAIEAIYGPHVTWADSANPSAQ